MTVMIDSVTGDAPPLASPIVAYYLDGDYGPTNKAAWTPQAIQRYLSHSPPPAMVSITVRSAPGARVADCEPGAMSIPETVNWCLEEIAAHRRPTPYADLYDWTKAFGLDAALLRAGIPRPLHVDGWVAHRGAPPSPLPAGFVAIQFQQSVLTTPYGPVAHAVDVSNTNGIWPGNAPSPPLTIPAPLPLKGSRSMIRHTLFTPPPAPPKGYWICDPSGAVYTFGDAPYLGGTNPGSHSPMPTGHQAVGFSPTPPTLVAPQGGYYIVTNFGEVYTFGNAPYLGGVNQGASSPMPPGHLATAIDATPSGKGYWITTDHGEVYTFGDAAYLGGPGPEAV